jgi:hypothetical protein
MSLFRPWKVEKITVDALFVSYWPTDHPCLVCLLSHVQIAPRDIYTILEMWDFLFAEHYSDISSMSLQCGQPNQAYKCNVCNADIGAKSANVLFEGNKASTEWVKIGGISISRSLYSVSL